MPNNSSVSLGKLGEAVACQYLKKKNYKILTTNFKTRNGEIDIVCKKNDQLIFVEVKSRISDLKGKPYEAITSQKLKHFQKAIYYFLSQHNLFNWKLRVDVISIEFNSDRSIKKLTHFENIEMENNL